MSKSKDGEIKEPKTAKQRVEFDIVGISPLSFGRPLRTERSAQEDAAAHDDRCWRERMHLDERGQVFIPPMMLMKCYEATAKYLGESIPGKRGQTYTKRFLAGIMIVDKVLLHDPRSGQPIIGAEVAPEPVYVNADGKKGGSTRVWRTFPFIPAWRGHVVVNILDMILQANWEKVIEYAEHAGKFNGMGRWAPRAGGIYGRFKLENVKAFE